MRHGARKVWGMWPHKMTSMASAVYFEVSISIAAKGFVRESLRYHVREAGEYGRELFQEAERVGSVIRGSHTNETRLDDNRGCPTAAAMSSTAVVASVKIRLPELSRDASIRTRFSQGPVR